MIPVLEEIGSLPDACQMDLARNLWWPARSKRATCSGTSKTRKKMRLVAAHTCPYRSVSPIRGRGSIRLFVAEEDGIVGAILLGSEKVPGLKLEGLELSAVEQFLRRC
jgi:hypothetical protein